MLPFGKVNEVAGELCDLLKKGELSTLRSKGIICDNARIRAILLCPACQCPPENPSFIGGTELMKYIFESLHNSKRPNTCARRYNLELWGGELTEIVKWFKSQKRDANPTFKDLCKHLNPKN